MASRPITADRLLCSATEIRLRAERKAGQLLSEMAETGERDSGRGGDRRSQSHGVTVKLDDLGVSRMQSHRWQKLGALDDEAFEVRTASAKKQAVSSVEATASERGAENQSRPMLL